MSLQLKAKLCQHCCNRAIMLKAPSSQHEHLRPPPLVRLGNLSRLRALTQPAQHAHLMISSYLRTKAVPGLPAHPAQRPLPVAEHAWFHSICPRPCAPCQAGSQQCCAASDCSPWSPASFTQPDCPRPPPARASPPHAACSGTAAHDTPCGCSPRPPLARGSSAAPRRDVS